MQIEFMKCSIVLLLFLLLTISTAALSQSDTSSSNSGQENLQIDPQFDDPPIAESTRTSIVEEADKLTLKYQLVQEENKFKEVIALTIMALVSLVIVLTFMKINGTCRPGDMVVASGLILIIFSTIILVLVATNEEQITAAIGVLGAIAGYLFGTASSRTPKERMESSDKNKPTQ